MKWMSNMLKMCNNPSCSVGVEQSIDRFCSNKRFKDGLNPRCKTCSKDYKKSYYQKNKEVVLLKTAEWQRNNPEKVSKRNKKWRDNNKDKMSEIVKKWTVMNPDKVRINRAKWKSINHDRLKELKRMWYHSNKATQVNWRNNNRGKLRSYYAKRRAMLINATPKWVDLKEIQKIYENCPLGYHVDHIIPLNHPLVCGLHVPWNLQYLPAVENIKKSNKIEELCL